MPWAVERWPRRADEPVDGQGPRAARWAASSAGRRGRAGPRPHRRSPSSAACSAPPARPRRSGSRPDRRLPPRPGRVPLRGGELLERYTPHSMADRRRGRRASSTSTARRRRRRARRPPGPGRRPPRRPPLARRSTPRACARSTTRSRTRSCGCSPGWSTSGVGVDVDELRALHDRLTAEVRAPAGEVHEEAGGDVQRELARRSCARSCSTSSA